MIERTDIWPISKAKCIYFVFEKKNVKVTNWQESHFTFSEIQVQNENDEYKKTSKKQSETMQNKNKWMHKAIPNQASVL